MAQSRDHSIVGVALLSALCSVLSSALFSRIFSHVVVRNDRRGGADPQADRPSGLRFEAPPRGPAGRRLTKDSGDERMHAQAQDGAPSSSGMIYACGGNESGFVRFVTAAEECYDTEHFYAWSVGGSVAAGVAGGEKETSAAAVTFFVRTGSLQATRLQAARNLARFHPAEWP